MSLHIRAYRPALATAVADAVRALPARPSIPILNTVRVTASDDGRVEIVGYDFDVCVRATLTADVKEPGELLVSGRPLAAMLAGMPDGTIDVEHDGSRLALTMPRVRGGLRTADPGDYPATPPLPPSAGTIPVDNLAAVLARVLPAARPVPGLEFAGAVQLTATADRLTASATDRYTVAIAGTAWAGPSEPATVEVTGKALNEALRMMSGDVTLHIGPDGFGIVGPDRVFTSRRLAVEFPRCQAVADRVGEPTTRALVRADEVAEAMARAARVVTGDRKPVRLSISADGGLTYDASSDGDDDVAGDLEAESVDGEPLVIGVNPQYLGDALKPLGSSLVELGARGPRKAFTVTSPDAPGDVHIIQPIFLP